MTISIIFYMSMLYMSTYELFWRSRG